LVAIVVFLTANATIARDRAPVNVWGIAWHPEKGAAARGATPGSVAVIPESARPRDRRKSRPLLIKWFDLHEY